MGGLIKAEFRKILTTKLWWAMMIPTFVVGLGWAWGVSALTSSLVSDIADEPILRELDIRLDSLSWSVLALSRGINIATIFPMVFGALALASEISRKTITTSFLTASSRASLLGAKAITYVLWGLIYGVVIVAATSLGTLIGSDSAYLPGGGDWLLIALAGLIATVLWTLLALGVGALFGSPVGALVVLLIYSALVGPLLDLIMTGLTEGSYLAGFLPNGSANGLTGSTASRLLFDQVQELVLNSGGRVADANTQEGFEQAVRFVAGAPGALSLWLSGLIFLVWTLLFFVTGLLRNQRRDVT